MINNLNEEQEGLYEALNEKRLNDELLEKHKECRLEYKSTLEYLNRYADVFILTDAARAKSRYMILESLLPGLSVKFINKYLDSN